MPFVYSTIPVGQTIRKLRRERGLTQEELAEQLNVTAQAVSKWENGTGMPDISQIVPLASIFGVSTDIIFGLDTTTADDEALLLIRESELYMIHKDAQNYLKAYDLITEGLRKYPNNQFLLVNSLGLGMCISLDENGKIACGERADEIAAETIRRANLVVSYSKNTDDIMYARQALVHLYCALGRYDEAEAEACRFPVRSDFTRCTHLAVVNDCRGDFEAEISNLCTNLDFRQYRTIHGLRLKHASACPFSVILHKNP